MSARITERQARALGLIAKKPARGTRKAVTGEAYHSRCCHCPEQFDTSAAEDRHLKATGHTRYDTLPG